MIAKFVIGAAAVLISGVAAQGTAPQWGQCGGQGWTGPTTCPSGWVCTFSNQWYSQCLQGTGPTTTNPPTMNPPTNTLTSTTQPPTGTNTAGPLGPTLLPNNLWVRAVAEPNYHKYMQSQTSGKEGTAVLGSHTTAAQIQLVNGQIVQQLSGGGKLYLTVADSSTSTTHLATSFTTTQNTNGQFVWSGDTLTWTSAGISRPNPAAWLACGGGSSPALYINLGPYAYNTPAGCADQTIHSYGGSTADF